MSEDNNIEDPLDLKALRLDQTYSDGISVRKVVTMIPVRKSPGDQHFVRVHPDPEYCLAPLGILVLKDNSDESYLVLPALAAELEDEIKRVALYAAITRQGTPFLWYVPLPGRDGKLNPWHQSRMAVIERAKSRWVRVKANQEAGGYDLTEAAANIGEPEWPDITFQEMIRIAFQGRVIDRADHPLILKLRGVM